MLKNKHMLYLFLLSSVLLMVDIFLYWNYTDYVVFWVWILSFLGVVIGYWQKIIVQISFFLFFLAIVLSFVPMGLPFFTIILYTTRVGLKFEKTLTEKFFFEKELEYNMDRARYIEDVDFVSEDKGFIYLRTYSKEADTIWADEDLTKFQKDKQTQH